MNNTFSRRSLSRLAGVCAALLLLTACGAPASSASSAAEPSATAEPTPPPTAAPKLYQASEVITVPDGSYTQTITSRYSETGALLAETIDNQPSGVTVNILYTVNEAGDPLTADSVSSQGSEDHYTYAYDESGRLTESTQTVFGVLMRTEYAYDAQGQLITETRYRDDAYDQTITYTYDGVHKTAATKVTASASGFTETVTRDFDTLAADGLYIETTVMDTNPAGTEMVSHNRVSDDQMVYYHSHFADRSDADLNYEYDDHGNLTRTWGTDSSGECDQRMENRYDEAGNLVEVITYYDGEENMRSTYTYLPLEEVLYTEAG